MSTITSPTVNTYTQTAKEKRTEILAHRDATKGTMKALTGNTWPVKSLLYAYGSLWNKEAKVLEVPEHVHAECQAVIDGYEKAHPKVSKPKADKPAVTITAAQVKAAAVVDTRPVVKGTASVDTLCKRLANLGDLTDAVVTDLLRGGHTAAAAEAVKAMAGFNLAHKALAA